MNKEIIVESRTIISTIVSKSQNGGEVVQNFTRLLEFIIAKVPEAQVQARVYTQNLLSKKT